MLVTLGKIDNMVNYDLLNRQLKALIEERDNPVAQLANAAALLKDTAGWFWVGFYIVREGELLLGPFQGPVACYSIGYGKGVCGTAWKKGEIIIVPDVEQFPGHIACSSLSRSEIVVPIFKDNTVVGVLDIDSLNLDEFTPTDAEGLEHFCAILAGNIDFEKL